jgi:hypothetical protein
MSVSIPIRNEDLVFIKRLPVDEPKPAPAKTSPRQTKTRSKAVTTASPDATEEAPAKSATASISKPCRFRYISANKVCKHPIDPIAEASGYLMCAPHYNDLMSILKRNNKGIMSRQLFELNKEPIAAVGVKQS